MIDFFQSKFNQTHFLNLRWIRFLIDSEVDLSPEIKLSVSRLINSRHVWLANLTRQTPESALDDVHPERFWVQLETDNHYQWDNFFMNLQAGIEFDKQDEESDFPVLWEDVAFQVLQENARFLGQLELNCNKIQLELPNFGLIPLI